MHDLIGDVLEVAVDAGTGLTRWGHFLIWLGVVVALIVAAVVLLW